ncbi:MAG: glycosyltransferase [Promethearchaeota archaeon]
MIKNILYMGCYADNIHRNVIFLKGLRKNNLNVYEYNVNSHNILKNLKLFLKNFKKLLNQNFELILFHSEAFIQFPLVKLLSTIKRVPLVHDIFISKLQTIYYDRQQIEKRKMPKFLLRTILFSMDLIECRFSDSLLLDTYSHIKFFHEKFNVPIKKFRKVLVGSMDDIFYPLEKDKNKDNKFIVGFLGTFIPLQGVEYIIKAAKILEKDDQIVFHIIGDGQTYKESRMLANRLNISNIIFFGYIPINKIPELIANFDINLGIFGDTAKAMQVIPTKVFDGMAMKKPMITLESPAIKELFKDNDNIILCERANPESLAEAILKLKNNEMLREKISKNAYELFKKYCTIEAVGKQLKKTLNELLNN